MNKRSILIQLSTRVALCTMLCAILTGCIKEELPLTEWQHGDRIEFRLNIPSSTPVVTKVTTAASAAELEIKNGYCLIYSNNTSSTLPKMTYTFKKALDISNNSTANPTITIPKKIAIEATDVVVFILNAQFSGVGSFGDRLDDVQYNQIGAKFPLSGNLGFETTSKGIPMYGEITGFSSGGSIPTMVVYRSVAKLQVKLKSPMAGSASDVSGFTTTNVKYQIFNLAITGNVNHGENFNSTITEALNSNDQNQAPESTINDEPINKEIVTIASGENYTGASYIYEYHYSDNIIGANSSTPTSISRSDKDRLAIILYNTATSRYYRLDLCNSSHEYIDVVRNNHYQIVINEVNDNGYASADEAIGGNASNIIYDIIDNTGTTTISNGKYAISVGEEYLANKYISNIGANPITIADDLRYIIPTGVTLPSGITKSITCIDATTGSPIDNSILTLSSNILSDIATPLTLTFNDLNYSGEIAFEIELGDLHYKSATIYALTPIDANCVIVPLSGKTIAINTIDRVNTFWGATGDGNTPANILDDNSEWYAEVIWADFDYAVGDKISIKRDGATAADYGTGIKEGLHVTIGNLTTPGNVIIGLKKKGASSSSTDYLWSWHLWITDYNPDTRTDSEAWTTDNAYSTPGGQIHSYNDKSGVAFWSSDYNGSYIMDRNLGAVVSTGSDGGAVLNTTSTDSYGMLYQWGRKDPFPYANGVSTTIPTFGKITSWPDIISGTKTKAYTINNPHKFVTATTSQPTDWQIQDDESWKDELNAKSLYDPCPYGWKIAPSDTYSNFSSATTTEIGTEGNLDSGSAYTNGGNISAWYPAGGFLFLSTGVQSYTGSYATFMSSSHLNTSGNLTYFVTGIPPQINVQAARGYGFEVRCIKR